MNNKKYGHNKDLKKPNAYKTVLIRYVGSMWRHVKWYRYFCPKCEFLVFRKVKGVREFQQCEACGNLFKWGGWGRPNEGYDIDTSDSHLKHDKFLSGVPY